MLCMQANMPMLTDYDVSAIMELSSEFEIDFIALTHTCSRDDVVDLRSFMDHHNLQAAKIVAKVS